MDKITHLNFTDIFQDHNKKIKRWNHRFKVQRLQKVYAKRCINTLLFCSDLKSPLALCRTIDVLSWNSTCNSFKGFSTLSGSLFLCITSDKHDVVKKKSENTNSLVCGYCSSFKVCTAYTNIQIYKTIQRSWPLSQVNQKCKKKRHSSVFLVSLLMRVYVSALHKLMTC